MEVQAAPQKARAHRDRRGLGRDVCELNWLVQPATAFHCLWSVLGTSCLVVRFHQCGTGRGGSVGMWLSHCAHPAPAKVTCLSSTAKGSSTGLDVRSCSACRGQEVEPNLTQSSEVVVTSCNPFIGQHLHGAAQTLGRSSSRQGSCFPDQQTVSKPTAASCPRNCRQDTPW